jgi:hypothetical protein
MLPKAIENLIHEYVSSMCEGSDLPSLDSVLELRRKSDIFVMNNLGFVMGLPTGDMMSIRCRIILNNDFMFYFRLGISQKVRFIRALKRGIVTDLPTSCMVWLMLQRHLINYPEYKKLFVDSLLMKFLLFFSARDSILDQIS